MAGGTLIRKSRLCASKRSLLGMLFVLLLNGAHAAETVQSLRYGTTLFYYFQQDYFNTLTELLAAQELDALGVHSDNAELLRGGVSLSYGMDNTAEQIFEALLAEPGSSADHDRAWFFLAKMAWQRGELERAASALEKMDPAYNGPLADEANYLRASIGLRLGDDQLAVSYTTQLPSDSPWLSYLYYNLGATYAAQGEWTAAAGYFERVGDSSTATPESKALQDKALTASGYVLLASGNFEQALDDFTRVRMDSPLVDRALLGYGWAYSEMGDYQSALGPWQTLGTHSLLNDSVRESLLAVPYAYEQLKRPRSALEKYRHAGDVYARELEAVQEAVAVFQHEDLSQQLGLADDYSREWMNGQDWLFGQDMLPRGEHLPYIAHLITQHDFQIAMRELRDLHSMALYLADASQRLHVLSEVDEGQQEAWSSVLEGDRFEQLQVRQQPLLEKIESLQQRLDGTQVEQGARSLAGPEQQSRWARLDSASELAAALGKQQEYSEKLAFYRGLLIWQDNEDYPARSWQLKRQLGELLILARQSKEHALRVEEAMAHRQQSDFAPRITTLQERVRVQERQVQASLQRSQTHIRELAVAELQIQAAKLLQALGQSRLAVARLYDASSGQVPR
jgi:tetratricopeptide (TPR) repeat protein